MSKKEIDSASEVGVKKKVDLKKSNKNICLKNSEIKVFILQQNVLESE